MKEKIYLIISCTIMVYLIRSAFNLYLHSTFSINSSLMYLSLTVFFVAPLLFILRKEHFKIEEVFEDRKKQNEGLEYPSTMDITSVSYGETESRWYFWKPAIINAGLLLTIISPLFAVSFYGLCGQLHWLISPFSNVESHVVNVTSIECKDEKSNSPSCMLTLLNRTQNQFIIEVPYLIKNEVLDSDIVYRKVDTIFGKSKILAPTSDITN